MVAPLTQLNYGYIWVSWMVWGKSPGVIVDFGFGLGFRFSLRALH